MKSEVKTIIGIINAEKNDLEIKLRETNNDSEEINKLAFQIQILESLSDKLYHIYEFQDDEGIFEILRQNYGNCNTELIALNGEKYIVDKDEPVSIQGNLLSWHEPTEDITVISPIVKSINLDTILEINTIKED